MDRREAFADEGVWFGEVHTEPESLSAWHHHGEHATYGRVIAGSIHFEFGRDGGDSVDIGPGGYFMVPPHTVHREGNPGGAPGLVVLTRVGSGPTAFNVDAPDA